MSNLRKLGVSLLLAFVTLVMLQPSSEGGLLRRKARYEPAPMEYDTRGITTVKVYAYNTDGKPNTNQDVTVEIIYKGSTILNKKTDSSGYAVFSWDQDTYSMKAGETFSIKLTKTNPFTLNNFLARKYDNTAINDTIHVVVP